MKKFLQQYKSTSILAMGCGLVTVILGSWAALAGLGEIGTGAELGAGENISYLTISLTILINLFLHVHGYLVNKREGSRQANVLMISIVEAGYVAFLGMFFWEQLREPGKMGWQIFAIVFAFYLWVNGSSLASMPSSFPVKCGIIAMMTGMFLFLFAQKWTWIAAVLVGISLIVNGLERVMMSMLGGKKSMKERGNES